VLGSRNPSAARPRNEQLGFRVNHAEGGIPAAAMSCISIAATSIHVAHISPTAFSQHRGMPEERSIIRGPRPASGGDPGEAHRLRSDHRQLGEALAAFAVFTTQLVRGGLL